MPRKKKTEEEKSTTADTSATKSTKSTKKAVKKKPATKKAAKKTTAKKSSKKSSRGTSKKQATNAAALAMRDIIARARDHFKRAHPRQEFVLHSGETLQDLRELAEALDEMHHHVFLHHVNDSKHDFAAWVEHVLEEEALAQQLQQTSREPKEQQRVIYRYIVRRTW